ncbi:MAG TPA: biopolymer transporter ExbD [Candidatus Babeliales bacterium]|nr:biopolymer transporter ExbD [Candidatus Babeliales bacterium]
MRQVRRKKRAPMTMQEVVLTPLIDTALTLLVIFMVTAPIMHNGIKVELPKGQAKDDGLTSQELIVYVDKKGAFFFNDTAIKDRAVLIKQLKGAVGADTEKTVFIKADKSVSYGAVIELVDHIKVVGGINYVALATTPT